MNLTQIEGGSPNYKPPEIYDNIEYKKTLYKRDVYSFGVIMKELFFEQIPCGVELTLIMESLHLFDKRERDYLTLMVNCCEKNPDIRPEWGVILQKLKEMAEN